LPVLNGASAAFIGSVGMFLTITITPFRFPS
jgi:hypothetical protein